MKFWKYITICAAIAAVSTSLTACGDDDDLGPKTHDYTQNFAYIYQPNSTYAVVEYKANGQFLIDVSDTLALMPVRYTKAPKSDVKVEVSIDPALVAEYNAAHGTDYAMLTGCSILNPSMTIKAGEYTTGDSILVSFGDHSGFQTGASDYILPVVITSAPGATISKSSRIFLTFTSTYRANKVTIESYTQVVDSDVAGWESAYRTLTINDLAQCQWAADDPITFNLTVDPSLVDAYNAETGETYLPLNATLAQSTVTIAKGETLGGITLNVGDYTSGIQNDQSYCIPLKISNFSGVGAEVKNDVQVVYVILTGFLPTYTVTTSSSGTMITNPGTWTANFNGFGEDYECDHILTNTDAGTYEYVWDYGESATITADLGEVVNGVSQIGFKFYAWYYSTKGFPTFETSLDGNKWTEWTLDGTFPNQAQYLYAHLAKPAKMRYFRVTFGDPAYSSNYGSVLKRIWFYN